MQLDQRQRNDLDNFITGHYGEDQFRMEGGAESHESASDEGEAADAPDDSERDADLDEDEDEEFEDIDTDDDEDDEEDPLDEE